MPVSPSSPAQNLTDGFSLVGILSYNHRVRLLVFRRAAASTPRLFVYPVVNFRRIVSCFRPAPAIAFNHRFTAGSRATRIARRSSAASSSVAVLVLVMLMVRPP